MVHSFVTLILKEFKITRITLMKMLSLFLKMRSPPAGTHIKAPSTVRNSISLNQCLVVVEVNPSATTEESISSSTLTWRTVAICMGSAATQRALCRTDAGSVVKAEENACYLEPAATIARMGTRRTKDKLKCLQWLEKPVTIDSVMAVRYGVQAFGGFNCVPRYTSTTMVEIPYTIYLTGCASFELFVMLEHRWT